MGGLLAELRRRHIFRIGAVYVVVAWGIIQVLDVLSQLFELPDWIAQPAVVVLAIGFPVALILAWMIVGATDSADSSRSLRATGTDWLIGGGLIVVLAFMGYQQFASSTVEVVDAAATSVADEMVQNVSDRLPNSIAVLPFDNVSPDPDDAYFAVGVHDEILSHLYKLPSLNPISRNSVLEYENSTRPIPEIANELNVEMVMQGSVRLADDQVRVGVQLYDDAENIPMWTETYEGDLSDIFGIQADIAMNIANSLQAGFSVMEQESMERTPTNSTEAYEAYLRAVTEFRAPGFFSMQRRTAVHAFLDEALSLDPNFASAHGWKAWIYSFSRELDPVTEQNRAEHWAEMDRLTETHADMALTLDPSIGLAHTALAFRHFFNWRIGLGLIELDRSFQVSPNYTEVLNDYELIARAIRGEPEESVRLLERVVELDPNNDDAQTRLADALQYAGRYAEAVEIYRRFRTELGRGDMTFLARSEFALGNHEAALEALRLADQADPEREPTDPVQGIVVSARLAYGYGLLGQTDDAQLAFERVREIAADWHVQPSTLAMAYMGIGDYDAAREQLNMVLENRVIQVPYDLRVIRFNLWEDPMLEEPEWVELRDMLGDMLALRQ